MNKKTAPEIFGLSLNTILLFIFAFSTTYPFWHVIMYSISDSRAAMSGGLFFIPRDPTLLAYRMLFKTKLIFIVYRNTIIRTVAGTGLSVLLSSLTAYPLSLARFKGRSFFALMIFFTMLFSGGMIPTYLVVKNLGLLDSL